MSLDQLRATFLGSIAVLSRSVEAGKPHPCAPPDIAKNFGSFGKQASKSSQGSEQSSSAQAAASAPAPSKSSSKPLPEPDYQEFFEMPKRYWRRIQMEDAEIEAIMVRGLKLLIGCPDT